MKEKQKISDDEYLIAGTLSDLIERLETFEAKYKVANARDEIICQDSGLGEYRCTVRVPFGMRWACDLCLEHELFELWKAGVHTVSSCCGHGRVPPYIQVLHGNSVQKMHELKYTPMENEACPDNPDPAFRPKTFLPCFSSCSKCAKCELTEESGITGICTAEDYDINQRWCFVPRIPKENGRADNERVYKGNRDADLL